MVMASSAGSRPKQRTKTFTGCWTCRSRHVKCDEQRPHCQKCLRNGWQCQGYNIRLEWAEESGGSASQKRRRANPMTLPPEQCLSSKALTAAIAELDNHSNASVPYESGPFSVFPVSAPGPSSKIGADGGPLSDSGISTADTSMNLEFLCSDSQDTPMSTRPSSNDLPQLDYRQAELSKHSSEPPKSPVLSPGNDFGSQTILVPSNVDYQSPDGHSPPPLLKTLGESEALSLIQSVKPYTISMPESELVHHWVTFISGNLLLIDTPDNPCRTIFVPMALQGAESRNTESNMNRTIFHAICSASAFSLYHLRNDESYHSLALTHDQQALQHLRYNLNQCTSVNEATLAAILACLTAEAISGRKHRWRTHLAGVHALLEKGLDPSWTQNASTSSMLQSYLSVSSLCNLRISSHLLSLLDGPPEMNDYLERAHGMTKPLVRFLANLTDKLQSEKPVTAEGLDDLESQLYQCFPHITTSDTQNAELIQHAVNAFYYATVIYYRRTLRRVPSVNVQDLVEKAVENLETAEALSGGRGGSAYNWPSLVVAAECGNTGLQDRMLTWFHRKRRHGLHSISAIRDLVTVLWQRRTAAGSDVHWQDVANEENFDIMFV